MNPAPETVASRSTPTRDSLAASPGSAIYRVQDKEGRGPWRPGFSHKWVEDREDHDNLVPWLYEFGRVDQTAIYGMAIGCGCLTLEQLRRWFTESEYRKLQRYGYHAVRIKVGRVLAASDIQCVFERAKPLRYDVERVELYSPNTQGERRGAAAADLRKTPKT